jgi:hypothetical protein
VTVRELSGWTPRQFTQHTYDDDGRLERSVTWTESRFSPQEVALLLASRRQNIGPHGIAMDEALNPDNRGRFVAVASRDYAQAELNAVQKHYRKKYPHDDLESLQWRVELVVPVEDTPDDEG